MIINIQVYDKYIILWITNQIITFLDPTALIQVQNILFIPSLTFKHFKPAWKSKLIAWIL